MPVIHCTEPDANPSQLSLELGPDEDFALYALGDLREQTADRMRVTVLRRLSELVPPGASLVFIGTPRLGERVDGALIRVREVGRDLSAELSRDGTTSRLLPGTDLPSNSTLSLDLGDRQTQVVLEVSAASRATISTVSSATTSRRSWAAVSVASTVWLVPTLAGTLASPKARVVAWVSARFKRLGLNPAIAAPVAMALVGAIAMGWYALHQRSAAVAALEREQQAMARVETAERARDAALGAEATCQEARGSLSRKLQAEQGRLDVAVQTALGVGAARTMAAELGGDRMGEKALINLDDQTLASLLADVAARQGQVALEVRPRCLEQAPLLGRDLPLYALLWHGDAEEICPDTYHKSDGTLDRAGAWGLSSRIARAFGPPASVAEGTPEPRDSDRWSAVALASGLRSVQGVLLSAGERARPPVLPGQSQLWALALWDALNRLPSPADGALDGAPEMCLEELLVEVQDARPEVSLGEPVLPDIVQVAAAGLPVTPSQACPWPSDALALGAGAALRASAALAHLNLLEAQAQDAP